jgi:thiamine biosynthesis lipoprotein
VGDARPGIRCGRRYGDLRCGGCAHFEGVVERVEHPGQLLLEWRHRIDTDRFERLELVSAVAVDVGSSAVVRAAGRELWRLLMQSYSAAFEAIGVLNQVSVDAEAALPRALEIARADVRALDEACSRFRADSELAAVNRAAGSEVSVGPLLLEIVEVALLAAAATGGLVDPTVGAALGALGYDRDFTLVAGSDRTTFRLVPAAGWQNVDVDRRRGTIRIPAGAALDLGAVAKAFAADRIAARIRSETGAAVLVSLGGDIAVGGAPSGGWPIRVTDDHRRLDGPGQTVAIADGGLATSSIAVRRWRAGGGELHHIVDPTSGRPAAEHWRTASVAAATCIDANAAATAAILKGEDAPAWLEGLGLAARLVRPDCSVVSTARWPGETP